MRYYRYLYVGSGIKNLEKTKRDLNSHKGFINLYVIGLNPVSGLLEIINTNYLKIPYYRKHSPIVIGVTYGYDEALKIVESIVKESITCSGNANIKDYLIKRVKNA